MGEVLEAALLGLVQGLTEFLPVSSSGHLAILQNVLGWDDPSRNLAFNVAVHVGSLGAVLIFVRREIAAMLTRRPRLLLATLVATLPVAVAGLAGAKDAVESLASDLRAVGLFLVVTGLLLALARRIREGARSEADLTWPRSLAVGVAQAFALLPGISRSGTTLVAGLGAGLKRDEALRFAFLLGAPAIAGAALLMSLEGGLEAGGSPAPLAAGVAASFLSSLAAMRLMVSVVARRRLRWFALYCVAVGVFALGWAVIG